MVEKYSKKELQEILNTCKSKADFCRGLGIKPSGGNYKTIDRLIKENNLDDSMLKRQPWNKGITYKCVRYKLEEILIKNSSHLNTNSLKKRLFKEGILEEKCAICGEIKHLEMHHLDGNPYNNELSNLQILCPNCHAETHNYRGKNTCLGRYHNLPTDYIVTDIEEDELIEKRRLIKKISGRKGFDYYELKEKSLEELKEIDSKYINPKEELKEIECPTCHKKFHPKGQNTKYCSVECYREDNKGKRPLFIQLINDLKN